MNNIASNVRAGDFIDSEKYTEFVMTDSESTRFFLFLVRQDNT